MKFGRVPVLILRHVSKGDLHGKRQVEAEVGHRRREGDLTCLETICERDAARSVHVVIVQHVLAVARVSIPVVLHATIPWAEAVVTVFILPKRPVGEIPGTNVRVKIGKHIRGKRGHRALRGRCKWLDGRRFFVVHPVPGLEVAGLSHEDHQDHQKHRTTRREGRGCAGHDSRRNVEDQEGLNLS